MLDDESQEMVLEIQRSVVGVRIPGSTITFSCPKDLEARIYEAAEYDGYSVSALVRGAMGDFLARRTNERKTELEARIDVAIGVDLRDTRSIDLDRNRAFALEVDTRYGPPPEKLSRKAQRVERRQRKRTALDRWRSSSI